MTTLYTNTKWSTGGLFLSTELFLRQNTKPFHKKTVVQHATLLRGLNKNRNQQLFNKGCMRHRD